MFSLSSSHRYYLYTGICDMRKSFDSLCGLVREAMDKDPLDGAVYIFLNRRRSHIKLLHWESGGFVLYYKRLEAGCFDFPKDINQDGLLSWSDLVLMIAGVEVYSKRQKSRYGI